MAITAAVGVAGWMPVLSFLSLVVRDQLGGSLSEASWLLVTIQGATGTVGLSSAWWMQRTGSRWTYAAGTLGMALFVAVIAAAPSAVWFLAVAPVAGLALGFHWTGLQAYALEVAPHGRRGLASGIISFVTVVSPGLAGILHGALAEAFGLQTMATAATAFLAAAVVSAVFLLPSTGRSRAGSAAPVSVPALARVLRDGPVAALALSRAATTVSFAAFTILAGPQLIAAGGDLRTVGLIALTGSIGGALAQIGIGRLSDAIGRRGVLAIALVIGAAATAAFGFSDNVVLLLVLLAAYFLAFWAYQTLMLAMAGDIARTGTQGPVVAILTSSFSWGVAIGAIVTAFVAESAPESAFVVGAAAKAVALAALPWLHRNPAGGATDASRRA